LLEPRSCSFFLPHGSICLGIAMVAATNGITVLFFVLFPSSVAACEFSAAMQSLMKEVPKCQDSVSGATPCEKVTNSVCCVKKALGDCAELPGFDSTMETQLNTMKGSIPGASDCSISVSCSGGGGDSPAPAPTPAVPQNFTITNIIKFGHSHTKDFNLADYVKELQEKTGDALATAVVDFYEIVLKYVVPPETTDDQLKEAVAKAVGAAKEMITILTGSRRLTSERRLTVDKQVAIKATDQTTAKSYKTKSSSADTIKSLGADLGGDVTVKEGHEPVMQVKVTNEVSSTKTKAELETKLAESAKSVGGTTTFDTEIESSSGAFRSDIMVVTSVALAVAAGFV